MGLLQWIQAHVLRLTRPRAAPPLTPEVERRVAALETRTAALWDDPAYRGVQRELRALQRAREARRTEVLGD